MLDSLIERDHILPLLIETANALALAYLLTIFIRGLPLRHVPGPWLNKYLRIRIAVAEVQGRRNQQILDWHRQYGPIVCIAPNQVSLGSIEAIREIYSSTGRADKSTFFNHLVAFNSRSVFTTLSFAEHKRKRAVVSAFFQYSNIYRQPAVEAYLQDRVSATVRQIESGCQGETPVDFYALANWYSFDSVNGLVLGSSHGSKMIELAGEERDILRGLKQARGSVWQRIPWLNTIASTLSRLCSSETRQLNAEQRLSQWVSDRVMRAIKDPNPAGFESLVTYLASKLSLNLEDAPKEAHRNHHFQETVRYISAEVLDNINAAEASVAAAITCTVWFLSIHPDWQERLRRELMELPMQSNGLPAYADINQAPVLNACLKEAYRLKPPSGGRAERVVPAGGRVVSNLLLPAKTVVAASIAAVQTNATTFADEAEFQPSRWLDADETNLARMNSSLLPFGYGARICLGYTIANIEVKLLLAALFLRYEIVPSGVRTGEGMTQAAVRDGVRGGLDGEFQFRPVLMPN